MVLRASAPFLYVLWLAGGFDGLGGLDGRGGGDGVATYRTRDGKGGLGSWMVGWVVSWMVSWAVSWAVIFPIVGIHKNGVFRHKRVRVVPFSDKKGLQFLCADWLGYRLIVSGLQ